MVTIDHELFIDIVYLLTHDVEESDKKAIRTVLEIFEDEIENNDELNSDINNLFVSVINAILAESGDMSTGNAHALLLKLKHSKLIDTDDPELMESLKCIVEPENNPEKCGSIRNRLYKTISWYDYSKTLKTMLTKVNRCKYTSNSENQDKLLTDVLDMARSFSPPKSYDSNEKIDQIDFNDINSINAAFEADVHRSDSDNVLKTGLQGFNRMLGENGGICYGEAVMIYALSHHFKSGWLMKFARWIVTLNKPMPTPGLKPLLLHISLENEVIKNTKKWHQELYLNTFGTMPPKDLTIQDMGALIHKEFTKNGWHFKTVRRLGDNFDYNAYLDLLESLKKDGYKVLVVINDYMALMNVHNENKTAGLGKLATDTVNHARYNGYAFITGNQLNGVAYELASSGQTNVVKQFSPSCIADCKRLEHEFDLTLYSHIEKNMFENSYLTVARGKHRYMDDTPTKDKSFAYKFLPEGIPDDINGKDMSVKDIYAEVNGDDVTDEAVDILSTGLF